MQNLNSLEYTACNFLPSTSSVTQALVSKVKPISDVSTETKLQFCPTSQVNFTLSKYTNWKSLRKKRCTGMYIIYNIHQYMYKYVWLQKLKRLMKSCGERDSVQLSGLLAVQGWFVSFQKRMWQCVQKCKVSLYCSLRG